MIHPVPNSKRKAAPASPPNEPELRERLKDGFDRILSEIKQPPLTLDRQALLRGLEFSVTWYCDALTFGQKKPLKTRRGRLESIEKSAKRLQILLKDDILATLGPLSTTVQPREFLAALINAAQKALDPLPPGDLEDFLEFQAGFRQRSALEWLAGHCLRDVYELHFRREATPTLRGEYVRFVEIFMAQLQITVPSPRGRSTFEPTDRRPTISRALTSVRSGRPRRKVLLDDAWFDAIACI
jgi:hypothetical protein